jgi:dienelactone hydrolase
MAMTSEGRGTDIHVLFNAMGRGRKIVIAIAGLAAIAGAALTGAPYVRTAAFILDVAGVHNWTRAILPVRPRAVTTNDLTIPTRTGDIPARRYVPAGTPTRYVLVFPGVHGGGVDEPRLDGFARRLAGTGAEVFSVPLPELRVYRITPHSVEAIEDVVTWMTAASSRAPDGRVGIVGISFAGGLAIVAAGRPSIAARVSYVVSLGGHADLPRVMTYLCTGRLPDGAILPPHEYGVDIILLGAVDRLVPADQADGLKLTLAALLDAASDETMNPARSAEDIAEARQRAAALPEPARGLAAMALAHDVKGLGSILLPYVDALGGAPALSPDRSPVPHVPVFLLHGSDDTLVPSTETNALAADLRARGTSSVTSLVTPILSHADVEAPTSAVDAWRLVRFWTEALRVK